MHVFLFHNRLGSLQIILYETKERPQNITKERHQNIAKERHRNNTKERHRNNTKERHRNDTKERHRNDTNERIIDPVIMITPSFVCAEK